MTDLANRREHIVPNSLRPVSHRRIQVPAVKGVVGEAGAGSRDRNPGFRLRPRVGGNWIPSIGISPRVGDAGPVRVSKCKL